MSVPRLTLDHARAARHLARGNPIAALSAIERLDDPHALALQGIALAQLDEHDAARELLSRAARAFAKSREPLARSRALAAAAETAAAQRDFRAAARLFAEAMRALSRTGDQRNAAWTLAVHARLLALRGEAAKARRLLGRASRTLSGRADAALRAQLALAGAEIAARGGDGAAADSALAFAVRRLQSEIAPSLAAEMAGLGATLRASVASARCGELELPLDALALARLLRGDRAALAKLGLRRAFVVDTIARRASWPRGKSLDLRRRPVLMQILRELARRWPEPVSWRELAREVFEIERPDESLLSRCKVEIDRLRRLLPANVHVVAARNAWRLALPRGSAPVLLSLPARSAQTRASLSDLVAAFLADGALWSVADLAVATAQSASTIQRALRELEVSGVIRAVGRARARRYVALAPAGIASQMLLVGLLDPGRG